MGFSLHTLLHFGWTPSLSLCCSKITNLICHFTPKTRPRAHFDKITVSGIRMGFVKSQKKWEIRFDHFIPWHMLRRWLHRKINDFHNFIHFIVWHFGSQRWKDPNSLRRFWCCSFFSFLGKPLLCWTLNSYQSHDNWSIYKFYFVE